MATIIFNSAALTNLYNGYGGSLMLAINNQPPPLSACFGSGTITDYAASHATLFVFKGTAPTNFSSFNSISTRESDLLLALPVRVPQVVGYSNPTGSRFLVAGTIGVTTTNTVYRVVVTGNTLMANSNTNHNFIPGQAVTLTGVIPYSGNISNVNNVTFIVDTTPNASAWTANAANGLLDGNVVVANGSGQSGTATCNAVGIRDGTASWFVCARWGPGSNATTSSNLSTFGAVIGTISAPGGGGDLQIPATYITQGTYYSSSGMYINFPYTWTI